MGKKIVNNYHRKIFNELIDADINKELIDNVFNISQKQLETLKNKIVS
jgi:ribosomal protein S17E